MAPVSRWLSLALVGAAVAFAGCSAKSGDNPDACVEGTTVDKLKELMVVDEGVLNDDRASNGKDGAWSFRHSIEQMAPTEADASSFVMTWLRTWVDTTEINDVPTDRPNESRAAAVQQKIICPWLKRSPANACNADCSTCTAQELDLSLAPFRLIAIVNRMDLRAQIVGEPVGEARLVYALTDAAADDPASKPVAFTAIFEYNHPGSRSVQEWANAWHGLGQFATYDEPFRKALQDITDGFTARGALPSAPNGSALAQIRTNESFLDWIWQLREFGIQSDGFLRLRQARNTPAEVFNSTPTLTDWVKSNADAITSQRFELPVSMRAPAVDQLLYSWMLPDVDPALSRSFTSQTCNGCHSANINPSIDTVFHVSPFRQGTDKLSPFVYQPNSTTDDLSTRSAFLKKAICSGQ